MRTKIFALTCAALLPLSTTASAGGMAQPMTEPMVMAPEVVVEQVEASSSSQNVIVPLILIALIALATSGGGSTPAPVEVLE